MQTVSLFRFLFGCILVTNLLLNAPVLAQPAYSGPAGAVVFAKAQQLEAAGNKAAAAAAYQQAYEAYTSVDDSEGMTKALARKNALSRPTPAAAPARPAATAAAATQPLAGSVKGGRPVGLFFMTRYWIATHSLEKSTYYFAPNGQVYIDPTGFSAAQLAAVPAASRGSYTVAGGKLTVRWTNGQTESENVEPQAETFAWNMGIFLAGRPFASASQLVGSFEGGNSISTSSGSAAAVSGLTFRANGTYSGGSASSFGGRNEAGASTYSAGSSGGSAGRWSLSGWMLTLTDAAGRTSSGVAYPIEKNEKTGQVTRFYFNNVAYKRL
ncbi:hypothetical protein MUN81_13225 [Hymenobacter sp. 5317J-9]|uniref:hypothetical protein n=1 Tax=Hymenobacter sp. 5317J-9 TaxID=2932250 RepID=UPI001FD6776B|nr:hypothetical protein [Hymenobacter sp. 5317J-9]UOQ96214.1 hypothetical protein MUN81_13225 [Hymenobacter sp. 5317J-9]